LETTQDKKSKLLIYIIAILTTLSVGSIGYLVYDKVLNKDNCDNKCSENKNENCNCPKCEENIGNNEIDKDVDYALETGKYISEIDEEILTLNADNTFEFKFFHFYCDIPLEPLHGTYKRRFNKLILTINRDNPAQLALYTDDGMETLPLYTLIFDIIDDNTLGPTIEGLRCNNDGLVLTR